MAAHGMTGKQIASNLGLSARTVEDRFAEMRENTGAASKAELIAWGVAAGIVAPGAPPSSRQPCHPAPEEDTGPSAMNKKVRAWPGEAESDETWPVSSRCRVCRTPVSVAATGRPRVYCSPACKARAYRARQRAACPDSEDHRGTSV